MITKTDILNWLMAVAILVATACSHDDILPVTPDKEDDARYVELLIAVPAANSLTRGNPLGGEEGNGREQGVMNEDRIHDINIFFYKEETNQSGKGLGMNSGDGTKILGHFFYNLDNNNDAANSALLPDTELAEGKPVAETPNSYYGTQYISLKFKCSEELAEKATDINFLAVANVGKIQYPDNMTLGYLRNLQLEYYSNSWINSYDAGSVNAKKMDYFLMSTAYDEEYNYGGRSTGKNKIEKSTTDDKQYLGTTTMQRLYARLDLWYNSSNIVAGTENKEKTVKELDYQIKDKDGKGLTSHVYITNVLPVNVMQQPSFLFKRVTKDVEEISFTKKGLSALNADNYLWGGKESPSGIPTSNPDRPTNYVIERHTTDKDSEGNGEVDTWYGNTALSKVSITDISNADFKYSIVNTEVGKLSAYYDMERIKGNDDPDYDCNHISIISYANENTHPTDCFHPNYLTGLAFRGVYVPEKIYKTAVKSDDDVVASSDELQKIYRYSPTAGKAEKQLEQYSIYFSNETAAIDYAKAHTQDMGIITEYTPVKHVVGKNEDGKDIVKWGFICYYNLWLRHYNDENDTKTDPHPHLPMEYATVRNNIYRVAVDFSGPGDPTPTMREPDAMKARIFVRKWNYREEDEIIF